MDDYTHEYSLPVGKGKVKKVDMVITLAGKNPTILIECKKAGANLTSGNFNQLSEYFKTQISSKIGILTNGLVYKFYSSSLDDKRILNIKNSGTKILFSVENKLIKSLNQESDKLQSDLNELVRTFKNKSITAVSHSAKK